MYPRNIGPKSSSSFSLQSAMLAYAPVYQGLDRVAITVDLKVL
jgi:hypothetical protein